MTTKLSPHTAATRTARATWTGRIPAHGDHVTPEVPVAICSHIRKLSFRMLDVRRLRVLRELAARGTIAATAHALGYTAPAVSQHLAALARHAGVVMPERNGRTRRLTPAGEELVERTEGILRELEAAEAALERTTTDVAGVLRTAGFASAHRILLPRAIAALAKRHPDLRVTTRDMEPE